MDQRTNGYPYRFPALYALTYMGTAIYNSYIALYLRHIGFNQAAIGSLLAVSPFIAIITQPVWGMAGDRSRTKNRILLLLLAGSAATVVGYRVSTGFSYLLCATAVFTVFQASVGPVGEAITLEYLASSNWKYGPIRMAGTVGYAVMAVVAGVFANRSLSSIFLLYGAVTLLAFMVAAGLPKIQGHQSGGKKAPLWALFKDRELVLLMAFALVFNVSISFYSAFFPLWYGQMTTDNVLIGWAVFIAAISEIPFLLLAEKILKKFGTRLTMLGAAVVAAARWGMFYYISDVRLVLPLQVLHGLMYIVVAYSMAVYINRETPKELKATGQTVYWAVCGGGARIIGTMLGGMLSQAYGIRRVFLYNSFLVLAAACVFGMYCGLSKYKPRRPKSPETAGNNESGIM